MIRLLLSNLFIYLLEIESVRRNFLLLESSCNFAEIGLYRNNNYMTRENFFKEIHYRFPFETVILQA